DPAGRPVRSRRDMSRILPRGALTALLLVSVAAGCADGDDGATASSTGTVAVDGVLETSATTAVPTTDPPETTDPVTTVRRTTTTSSSSSTSSSTTTTVAPRPTSLALELIDLAPPDGGGGWLMFDRMVDDTGRLSMDVPVEWSERSTSTGRLADGSAAPYLAASPDMEGFLDGYDAPGLTVVVLPGEDDLEAALDSYRFEEDCRADGVRPYVGARMSGELRIYRDCGGTDTDIITVVGDPAGNSGTVLLLAQIRDHRDLVAVDAVLESMVVRRR
ncbi:MAG: hypothetical protein ABW219_02270, partial [Ilumatobacteraceae bacterium]